ncbi:hypothetical protein AD998_09235 [bacterium 336/3]|nr:hypothetical protein AD998_09235 [bacterium 336/3]
MKQLSLFLTIILSTILLSCATTKSTSTIYSEDYDKIKDQTTITIFPHGVVRVPGKWVKKKKYEVSEQYFYVGKDSVSIAIALQQWNKYEFSYNNPEVTPENFVRKFYEWDANYLKEKTNGQLRLIKENKEKQYLVWNLNSELGNDYFLFGLKGKTAYNLNIKTKKWNEEEKIAFLEKVFFGE